MRALFFSTESLRQSDIFTGFQNKLFLKHTDRLFLGQFSCLPAQFQVHSVRRKEAELTFEMIYAWA